jgi:glycerol-3-phosphate acyltransferase PlsX
LAFENALARAYDAARNNLLDRVQVRIARAAPLLAAREVALPVEAALV